MDNLINAKIKVEDMILEVNGKQVMIDSDLAKNVSSRQKHPLFLY